ncbi:fibronectin type III domain-containing protein 4-like [Lethenteron reissneri]|uniref:fibronectin type III domain-containing protein 4-like n=1 Tax=Lethenteron reissneri TaxID=7753 RepID=UPI002AB7469B|nr:fibronectin type III domain-containing protein 4-like [Lethenteron reissneri]
MSQQESYSTWLIMLFALTAPAATDGIGVPSPPANVSVALLGPTMARVSWQLPDSDAVIGFTVKQQKRPGARQRFITEVNTTARSCLLWGLEGASDYVVAVQALGRGGAASEPSPGLRFSTPPEGDSDEQRDNNNNSSSSRSSSSSSSSSPSSSSLSVATSLSSHGGETGLVVGVNAHYFASEGVLTVTVFLLWIAVMVLCLREYRTIKDSSILHHGGMVKPALGERGSAILRKPDTPIATAQQPQRNSHSPRVSNV